MSMPSYLPWGPEVWTDTIDALHRLQYHTSITDLCYLLRLCNVFGSFAHKFARVAVQADKQLHKGQWRKF